MYGRVRGKTDIRPTYRVTIPDEDTPFSPGFAQRPKKWRRWESNPRPRSRLNGFYERSRRSDLVPY